LLTELRGRINGGLENIGSHLGVVKMKPIASELVGGKSTFSTFEYKGKTFLAKPMRFDAIDSFRKEATAARAMHKVGLGEYTPRVYSVDGVFEGKTSRMIASEWKAKSPSLADTELYRKFELLEKTPDLVKERLILQDYLMSAWDRSASNILLQETTGAIQMVDYEMAFSSTVPKWKQHALLDFLGKESTSLPGPSGKMFKLRHHGKAGKGSHVFNDKVLKATIDSADDVIASIKSMDIPNTLKMEWTDIVKVRKNELIELRGVKAAEKVERLLSARISGVDFNYAALSEIEKKAIAEYQAGMYKSDVGAFPTIQRYLRDKTIAPHLVKEGVTPVRINQYVKNIDSAITKTVSADTITVYRGIREPLKEFGISSMAELKPGLEFAQTGYTSTSATTDIVKRKFINKLNPWESPKTLHITVKKGQHAFPTNLVEEFGEKEIILPRNSKFRVTRVSGNNIYIELK